MNNTAIKKFSYILLSIIVFTGIFVFLFIKLQNSYLSNDDIIDIILKDFHVDHGRYITYSINYFLLKILPNILNIHVQDFSAIISPILLSLNFTVLIFVISNSGYNSKQKDLLFPIISTISFITVFSFIFIVDYHECFDIHQFHMPYLFSIIFLILLINKLRQLYESQTYTKFDLIKLAIYTIIAVNGNEQLAVAISFGFLILFIDSLIRKQNLKEIPYIIYPLIISFIILFFICLNPLTNSKVQTTDFDTPNVLFNIQRIFAFMQLFLKKIILDNIFLWIMYISTACVLFKNKNKAARIYLYFAIGYLIFFLSLYFVGETYNYKTDADYLLYPRFFILHKPILFGFKVFLYYAILSQTMYICSLFTKFKNVFWLIIIPAIIYINNIKDFLKTDLINKTGRETAYIADKMAVFYFKQGKIPLLPREGIETIMPSSNNLMPKYLENDNYIGKIFTDYPYLEYIKRVYNVDTSKGMAFLPYKKAMRIYTNLGGTLTDKELKELKFSEIKKFAESDQTK